MTDTFVAIDLETTGLDPAREAIIEVAAVTVKAGRIVDEWSSLVNPGRRIPAFITRLTGITTAMVADAPDVFSLRRPIQRLLGSHLLVGHNVEFDLGFLRQESLAWTNRRLDTLVLASIVLPDLGRYGLESLASSLDLDDGAAGPAHRALTDARRTARLLLRLQEAVRRLDPAALREIVQAGEQLTWPETSFFAAALPETKPTAAGMLDHLFKPPRPAGRPLVPRDNPQPLDADDVAGLLRPGGNFSRLFPGFEHRPQQVAMAQSVTEAFNRGRHVLVEAGTGTGKSIGYLLPAAFWATQNGRRVVVSTNTINLQDQLIGKDLPELQRILPFEVRATVLKGKRNYLCTRLFQEMRHKGPANGDEMALYARLRLWLPISQTGDVAELSLRTPGERLAWDRLNADNDACTPDKCAAENCPLHVARRRAELAHILVVNHALLLADVASENRVLPDYADLIVDEAHHLESAVTDGLSFRADQRLLDSLLDEIGQPRAGLVADLQRRLTASLPAELSGIVEGRAEELRRLAIRATGRVAEYFEALDYFLGRHVNTRATYPEAVRFVPSLRADAEYGPFLESWEALNLLLKPMPEELVRLAGALADAADAYDVEDAEDLRLALISLARHLEETRVNLERLMARPDETMIYWAEIVGKRPTLHAAPLDIGPLVEKHIFQTKETVILTSATLRTAAAAENGAPSFAYLRGRLRANEAEELAVGSPFDYEASTLVYLPIDMAEPNQPGYQAQVEQAIIDVARAIGGRTLALFTSRSHLETTFRAVEAPLREAGITALAQIEGSSRQQLLSQFKVEGGRAVLLGTRSFWEGVDVPGEALQAVMIVKFPFDVPSDPIFAARAEQYDQPFYEYSIPEAVLRFRQGFGRLIRRQDDQGIVVVLDKRIMSRQYGQAFLSALPKCMVLRQRTARLGELSLRWLNRERS
jgi:DNA polymerase-3 subunit epsilon/ATP-dependent DNA helicase DinG